MCVTYNLYQIHRQKKRATYYYYYYYYKCSYYRLTVPPSQQLRRHFTKFKSKTVAQFHADIRRRSERTVQVSRITDSVSL